MERIYSAFFTPEIRRSIKEQIPTVQHVLTAEALEKHNQVTTQQENERLSPTRTEAKVPSISLSYDDLLIEKEGESEKESFTILQQRKRELVNLVRKEFSITDDLRSALYAALRAFILAYGAKAFTAVLLASRKWSSMEYGYANAVRLLLRIDTIRFGAFFGGLVALFRLTELAARVARGNDNSRGDRKNLALAGGVAGLALLIDSSSRRSTVSLYIFVRMLDVLGRHLTAIGAIPTYQYSSEMLFSLSNAPILYACLFDPSLLPEGYYHWILNMGNLTHHGLDHCVRQRVAADADPTAPSIPFRGCQPHYHMESCVTHSMKEWIAGFGRAGQMYLPVHFLPALIFKFSNWKTAPVTTSARILYATLCSSAFLTSYQTIVKLVLCISRNTLQRDVIYESWLGGLATGLPLFLEDPKRRTELMLYCVPRAFDILWQVLKRKRFVRYMKHSEVILFCISLSVIMSRPPEYFKPTYLRLLRFLFGSHII